MFRQSRSHPTVTEDAGRLSQPEHPGAVPATSLSTMRARA